MGAKLEPQRVSGPLESPSAVNVSRYAKSFDYGRPAEGGSESADESSKAVQSKLTAIASPIPHANALNRQN